MFIEINVGTCVCKCIQRHFPRVEKQQKKVYVDAYKEHIFMPQSKGRNIMVEVRTFKTNASIHSLSHTIAAAHRQDETKRKHTIDTREGKKFVYIYNVSCTIVHEKIHFMGAAMNRFVCAFGKNVPLNGIHFLLLVLLPLKFVSLILFLAHTLCPLHWVCVCVLLGV